MPHWVDAHALCLFCPLVPRDVCQCLNSILAGWAKCGCVQSSSHSPTGIRKVGHIAGLQAPPTTTGRGPYHSRSTQYEGFLLSPSAIPRTSPIVAQHAMTHAKTALDWCKSCAQTHSPFFFSFCVLMRWLALSSSTAEPAVGGGGTSHLASPFRASWRKHIHAPHGFGWPAR